AVSSLWASGRATTSRYGCQAHRSGFGALLVPINTRLRTEHAAYVLDQSDSTALIIAARSGLVDYLAMACELLPSLAGGGVGLRDARLPALRPVMVIGDAPTPGALAWSRSWKQARAYLTMSFAQASPGSTRMGWPSLFAPPEPRASRRA